MDARLVPSATGGYGSIPRDVDNIERLSDVPDAVEEEDEEDDEEDPDEFIDKTMVNLVVEGHVMVVKYRLENRLYEEYDFLDKNCELSVLAMAASYGYDQIVRLILKATDYKQLDDYNTAPMMQAVENNRIRIVKTLLECIGNEINIDSLRNYDEKPLLHIAAENGFNEILELLLNAGAAVDITTEDGETALHCAARGGNARGIELLVAAQAHVNAQQSTGLTPLHYAVEHCEDVEKAKAVVMQLFMAEAALDILDNDGINAASTAKTAELRSLINKEVKFRADCPVHYMVRNGNLVKLNKWFSDLNAHVMLAPHIWEGQYRQGAAWYPVQLTVNVVPVPHEGLYRFFGCDTDGIGPFTIRGSWSGTIIEATKLYEEQIVEYSGEIDMLTGVWSGDWTAGFSSDVFNFQIPLDVCPQCKQNKVPNRDEACLSCLPAEYNSDVNDDTVEEQRLRLEQIQESISKEILTRDENGRTALMCAADEGRAGILKVLLHFCKAKALDDTDNDGKTALDHALSRKLVCKHNVDHKNNEDTLDCIEMLSSYSKTTVDPSHIPALLNFKREQGRCTGDCVATLEEVNLAELAQQYEWDRLAAELMQTVPDHILNKLDTTGKAVLHHVVSVGKSDVLTLLLDQKHININLPTEDGEYPLMLAASSNRLKCVRLLLNAGADPLKLITPNHFDYMNFRKAPFGLLSDSKALYLLESKNKLKQQYPLYYIARVPNCEQASIHVKAKQSALHVAILADLSVDILQTIIDQSIHDVNSQDKHDETPLMIATKKGLVDHVKVLLQNGADVDCVNNRHESALMMAAVGGHVNIVSLLLENLADVDIRDGLDRTVLDLLDDYVKDHLMSLNKQEMMKAPHMQIQIIILSEIRQRQTSAEYRAKLAKSLSDVNVENAFRHNGFSKAINCSPELGVTFLNDCVTLDRHDVHFSNLELVYGKRVSSSALYALLNMKTDDPELIFESKTKCFEHVVMQRVLEIKWELFGQRKFFEMLLINMLLLVTMTISAITFNHGDGQGEVLSPTSFKLVIAVLSMSFTITGYLTLQGLRPRFLWCLARFHYDRSFEFDPNMEIPNLEYHKTKVKRYLKFTVAIGTILLTFVLIGLLHVTSLISSFSIINNIVLAGCALYFLVTEYQEARVGLASYLESPINIVQASMYTLILALFLPMQLDWIQTPYQVEIAVGSSITLTLWILSLQFLEVEETASYLLPMLTGLMKDLWNFFLFFGVFQIGITVTFYQLYKGTQDDGFGTLSASFLTSYFVAFGQVPLDSMKAFGGDISGYDWVLYILAVALIMAHSALVVIFLLNLLMATMNKTVDGGLEKAKTEALAAYAQCILRLEEAMNYSPKQVEELVYFIPPTASTPGKLNPIFHYSLPKSHYGITAQVEEDIQIHQQLQESWINTVKTIERDIKADIAEFENGFLDVEHFTPLLVKSIFSLDLAEIASFRVKFNNLFTSMHKSRGQQDRKELLDRFAKIAGKELAHLEKRLHQLWLVSEGDHARCVLIYQMAHQASMQDELNRLKQHIARHFNDAKENVDKDDSDRDTTMEDRLSALETQLSQMQTLLEKQSVEMIASMTKQFKMLMTAMKLQAPNP